MTEQDQQDITQDVADLIPADFDLDAWIGGAAVAERSVAIFARPDLVATMEEWTRRYDIAEKQAKAAGDEASLADDDELAALREEGERIHAEWMASKADWRVRALDEEEEMFPIVRAAPVYPDLPAFDEPEPKAPRDHAGSTPSAAYLKAHAAWVERRDAFLAAQKPEQDALNRKRQAAQDEVNLNLIATAVVSITFANGAVTQGVTVDQLRKMRTKLGTQQVKSLLDAASLATLEEPSIPVPFSRSDSKGGRR